MTRGEAHARRRMRGEAHRVLRTTERERERTIDEDSRNSAAATPRTVMMDLWV
jgi:hypothetical protein